MTFWSGGQGDTILAITLVTISDGLEGQGCLQPIFSICTTKAVKVATADHCPQHSPSLLNPLHHPLSDTHITLLGPKRELTASHLSWVYPMYLNHLKATPLSFLAHWSLELREVRETEGSKPQCI